MISVHILTPIPGARMLPFLAAAPPKDTRLFQELPQDAYVSLFSVVAPEAAELFIAPHEYAVLRKYPKVLEGYLAVAATHKKKLLLSAYQDDTKPISLSNTIVLRASAYKSTLLPQEIVMPAYVEDLGATYGTEPLSKGQRPTVGFVGKSAFSSYKEALKYFLRNYVVRSGVEREGVYMRRRAIRALVHDTRISFTGILRRSFGANSKTIELPPEEARAQYVANIRESLFTLSPRGDGNFSLRFYETLSLGRIPVVIDTDMPLPLENKIRYDDFIVRVPWQDIDRVGDYILKVFNRSDEEVRQMQVKARTAFEEHLYMPTFLQEVLTRESLKL